MKPRLVGVKYRSIFSKVFFFQYLLVNHCHRQLEDLRHPKHDLLPSHLQYFVAALCYLPDIWNSQSSIEKIFYAEGQRSTYVQTVVSFVQSLKDQLALCQGRLYVMDECGSTSNNDNIVLKADQNAVFISVKESLQERQQFYQKQKAPPDCQTSSSQQEPSRWHKVHLVQGGPGTGKSLLLQYICKYCIENSLLPVVACPTGLLASHLRNTMNDKVICDTIHSLFRVAVSEDNYCEVNWSLFNFDVILLDEVSLVPTRILQHIISTVAQLPNRPLLILFGDQQQQMPLETVNNQTTSTQNIFSSSHIHRQCIHFKLYVQHRCCDQQYQALLNHLRHWPATPDVLHRLTTGTVISSTTNPDYSELIKVMTNEEKVTILTVNRKGADMVNDVVVEYLFKDHEPLGYISMDMENTQRKPIYRGMRVMITHNVHKESGVVNGVVCTIQARHNQTIFLQKPNQQMCSVYPITYSHQQFNQRTVHPFSPAYAVTICKSQGKTLHKVILWIDVPVPPPGTIYVALSRVRRQSDMYFWTIPTIKQFQPVHFLAVNE